MNYEVFGIRCLDCASNYQFAASNRALRYFVCMDCIVRQTVAESYLHIFCKFVIDIKNKLSIQQEKIKSFRGNQNKNKMTTYIIFSLALSKLSDT